MVRKCAVPFMECDDRELLISVLELYLVTLSTEIECEKERKTAGF